MIVVVVVVLWYCGCYWARCWCTTPGGVLSGHLSCCLTTCMCFFHRSYYCEVTAKGVHTCHGSKGCASTCTKEPTSSKTNSSAFVVIVVKPLSLLISCYCCYCLCVIACLVPGTFAVLKTCVTGKPGQMQMQNKYGAWV